MTASPDPPSYALEAVAFADRLAREHVSRGGDIFALFAAFAGLVSARDKKVSADCLIALDRKLYDDATPRSA